MATRVTTNDMLEALRAAMAPVESGDGLTGSELAEKLGCCQATAQKWVRRWIKDGTLELVPLQRVRINGVRMTITGYRPKT
jgi:transposase